MLRYSLLLVLSTVFALNAYAQPGGGGTLPTESVDVVKVFDAQLLETQIVKQTPSLPALDTSRAKQSYSIEDRLSPIAYPAPKIKVRTMKPATDNLESYNGYAKLGYGTPNAMYGEAHYTLLEQKTYNLFLSANHRSARAKTDTFQRFSTTGGSISGDYYLEQGITVGGKIGYQQKNLYYYGYDTLPERISLDQALQSYKTTSFNVHSYNTKRNTSDLFYKTALDVYLFKDNYAAKERGFDFNIEGRKYIQNKHAARIALRTDFTAKDDTSGTSNLNNFWITPGFDFHHKRFYVKAGLGILSHRDSFHFLPDLETFVDVMPGRLGVFGGWKMDYEKNTFKGLTSYNPFLSPYVTPFITRSNKYFGGVRGAISGIHYRVQVSYNQLKDMAFFVTDMSDQRRRFRVISDSATTMQYSFSLSGEPVKNLKLTWGAQYTTYDLVQLDEHWGLPTFSTNLGVSYGMLKNNALTLRSDVFVEDGIPYLDGLTKIKTGTLADVNLGVHYQITKNIGAFVDGNNLLNNSRQRWNRYPQYGINVLGGITARF
jgi:hypothetical protein